MSRYQRKTRFLSILGVLMLASMACLVGGSGDGGEEGPDLEATQQSLEATQAALDASGSNGSGGQVTEEPEETEAPTEVTTEEPSVDVGAIDFSSLQSGDVLYATEFDGAGDWEDGWIHFAIPEDKDNYDAYVNNGALYLYLTDTNANTYVIFDELYLPRDNADVLVETYFDNVGSVRNNNISVVCRATTDGWYEFSVSSSGLWFIWKYSTAGGYQQLKNGGVPNYNKNITDHVLSATCIGDQLNFYFDGAALSGAETHDNEFREGSTGVSVSTFNLGDVEVEFLWFHVIFP